MALVDGRPCRGASRLHSSWIVILLTLVACSRSPGPAAPDPAATATRAAELTQLTQVAATLSAYRQTPATPQVQTTMTTRSSASPSNSSARPATAIPTSTQAAANTPAVS